MSLFSVKLRMKLFETFYLRIAPEYLQSYINEHEPVLKKCHKMMRQESV